MDRPVQAPRRYRQNQFDAPQRNCDIVMKGGITSGVVYPLAVVELATHYQFKNIGGASAGAIAAGFAAAAEYGRRTGGFLRFAQLPDEVSRNLLSLFQPTARLRPVFSLLLASLATRGWLRWPALIGVGLRGYWPATLVGMVPAAVLAVWAARDGTVLGWITVGLALLLSVATALAARFWRALTRDLPQQYYGLCTGRQQQAGTPALTDWLTDRLDHVAGLKDGELLTFGMLWGSDPAARRINLEVMTTNLTGGRPHRIPFESHEFRFCAREFGELFPARVIYWMKAHSEPDEHDARYWRLPPSEHLPVVVAVRMSLSFPVLLSAVPLYARDYTQRDPQEQQKLRQCWFSDGGICSNFPIHFFDNLWPGWPTFGITLERGAAELLERVFLPHKAGSGILRSFRAVESLGSFLSAVLDTMQEWRDTLQGTLPGFRDRIVHVSLDEDEGGLNLNMPPEVVAHLVGYGQAAGTALGTQFEWSEHRWTRFLVALSKLQSLFKSLRQRYTAPPPGDENFAQFLARHGPAARHYKASPERMADILWNVDLLMRCAADWRELRQEDFPRPDGDLRITPRP